MKLKTNQIAIVVPVYNEEKYLKKFINQLLIQVKKIPVIKKIYFINDGSTDNTLEILKQYNNSIAIINHKKNKGKGTAIRSGYNLAVSNKYDGIIFMDGDQQHDPKNLSQFISKLQEFPLVFGYRNLSKDSPFFRRWGNIVVKIIIRKLFHIERKDLLCGLMAIRSDVFNKITWQSDDYGVETEISTIVGKQKLVFTEINIKNIYLDKNKGVNLFDAFKIFFRIPYWYFNN